MFLSADFFIKGVLVVMKMAGENLSYLEKRFGDIDSLEGISGLMASSAMSSGYRKVVLKAENVCAEPCRSGMTRAFSERGYEADISVICNGARAPEGSVVYDLDAVVRELRGRVEKKRSRSIFKKGLEFFRLRF